MRQSASFKKMEAVLYDMDGLIVDTEPLHFQAFRDYMKTFGHEMPESLMPDFIGISDVENVRHLRETYQVDTPLEEMVAGRRRAYLELVGTLPLPALPGFWEFTVEAKQRGLKQAVVSSAPAEQVELVLQRLFEGQGDLGTPGDYFDAIVTGDDIEHNKPAPDIYLVGAERLGVPPALCLALEDSPPGAQSAAAAGLLVVAIPNEYTAGLAFPGAASVVPSLDAARRYLDW
ncbi:MAG: HAD family phosphatase [Armatimonadetes bacterium]|nr:HAD family phosphatase [Armatimonadota bacterium]